MGEPKKKILLISDHALSTSGVGTQSRHLINGLLKKDTWTVRQLGAAIKHGSYDVVVVHPDFIIKPIDGFGNRDMLRLLLAQERPDVLMIFTDPRFFIWLFEMEDEVHQVCPIVWWHVWDNYPTPEFNYPLYDATDAINCHSHITYDMCSQKFPEKTKFIPHALPPGMFYPLSDSTIADFRRKLIGPDRVDHFVGFWVNRNARRKRPNDLLVSWARFLDNLEAKHGHRKATLVLHTDPQDSEGTDMVHVAETLGIIPNVFFSKERIEFEKMNILHNIADFSVTISFAEGFGLGTLEAMHCGKPIIAPKTGGLTRQVVDHRDGSENGVALNIDFKTQVGSLGVPYIYEDYVSVEQIADAYMKLYEMGPTERKKLGEKARAYVLSEFDYQKTIDMWHESLLDVTQNPRYQPWQCVEF